MFPLGLIHFTNRPARLRVAFEQACGNVGIGQQRGRVGARGPRLPHHGRHLARPHPPLPRPQQRELDEQAVMREALSDLFDAETLAEIVEESEEEVQSLKAALGG